MTIRQRFLMFLAPFAFSVLLYLAIGALELINPALADITWNGQDVPGVAGFWLCTVVGPAMGIVFGLLSAVFARHILALLKAGRGYLRRVNDRHDKLRDRR